MIELDKLLVKLGLTRESLVDLGILIGTDYNPDGFEGIGPKKSTTTSKSIWKHREKYLKQLLKSPIEVDVVAIKKYFLDPPVTKNYRLEWREPDEKQVIELLVREHDFNEERVKNALERLVKSIQRKHKREHSKELAKWFTKK